MSPAGQAAVLVVLALLGGSVDAFYLPGVAPRTFRKDQPVNIKVQTLVSPESQLQFDFYQLPFCRPKHVRDLPENLGEALTGDKAHTSGFVAKMKKNAYCQTLCRRTYSAKQMEEFQDFAILDYRANMRLDNLPVAQIAKYAYDDQPDKTIQIYNLGFPIGSKLHEEVHSDDAVAEHYVLNNHLRFKILYHPAADELQADAPDPSNPDAPPQYMKGNLIVGFEVIPYSIQHKEVGKWNETCAPNCKLHTCADRGAFTPHTPQMIDAKKGGTVVWTYDIEWQKSDVKWASRWDVYLNMTDDKVHWFSIINSVVILVFLSAIVAMIFTRVLRNDLNRYNEALLSDEEKAQQQQDLKEESGWKLVHGDVFRSPPMAGLLAVYTGTGVQLLFMALMTLCCSCLGFLSPSNRGSLMNSVLLFFFLSGAFAGYFAARFCQIFKEESKLKITMLTALSFQGVCSLVFLALNVIVWAEGSSSAVPFGTFIAVMALSFFISVPLTFFGAYLGFRSAPFEFPTRTNAIPRQIPPQKWYMDRFLSMMVAGLLPFGAVFVELFFILSSIWQHRFYYFFGFLSLVFLILLVICAEITLVLCYLQVCAEDYKWWWRSFFCGGSTALYMMAYGAYHYIARAHHAISVTSSLIYFGYLGIICYAFFVMTGTVGFLTCFVFLKKIYGSVKID
eukprot:CAMPEP_0173391940 /NCGR_PEP_ID=MMETSP1356-20130122/18667_1 /TAXON_ID=77927 ORGANISM="Hemiselmis virescens, Strain PCC157" /NCGR_SAMPLE_ID=MMETSP1356 /ASSEMBLY_ACC=CAM_ASM_000847 /LENGTH=674 /DNA_ID=CAMNT_0014349645 /DNA_START=96 /DNA_END=2120 /DNA_ORIENTATION=+